MPKKLVTVAWSSTVEVDLPDNVGLDELEDYKAPPEIAEIALKAVKEAYANIQLSDGVITDVQDP